MIAHAHYDTKTLEAYALDQLGAQCDEVSRHLESCETCREQLEELARGTLELDDFCRYLGDENEAYEIEDSLQNPTLHILEPSTFPNALGRFARYEVMEVLGRGGMGIVLRGYDPALNRFCAIKVLSPELASNGTARRRFSREAKSAAAVVHPNVVPIQNVDEFHGLPFLVMPAIEGESLQSRINRDGPLSVIETVRIAAQIASGLAAAHAQGLVHRDIKPANILVENGVERVHITDFGLARAVDDANMTRSGMIAGTPQYMSPEQAHGDAIDHRSDLFSLGSLIYFLLTGHSPFRAETTMGVLNRIGNDRPRSLRSVQPDVPVWLESLVLKLLEKNRERRFQAASEVAKLLSDWLAHLQSPDDHSAPRSSPRIQFKRIPPWIRLLATGLAGGMLLWFANWILLEFDKGTLKIETNVAWNVPIRIKQDQTTVESLVVSKDGATTRLRAGNYVIHVDGDSNEIEIQGDHVTLKRGDTWIAKVQVIPKKEHDPGEKEYSHNETSDPGRILMDAIFPINIKIKDAVDRWNAQHIQDLEIIGAAPLTEDEVLACLKWGLSERRYSKTLETLVQRMAITRIIPAGWSLSGGRKRSGERDDVFETFEINLNTHTGSPISIRTQFVSPPENLRKPSENVKDRDGIALEKAIAIFNASRNQFMGKPQPPLTLNEVLSAILLFKDREESNAVGPLTLESFLKIAKTHELPKGAYFEVIPQFETMNHDTFYIWSVRIVMPQIEQPGWTYGFSIREQFLGLKELTLSNIAWGQPAKNGIQAGYKFIPSQRNYLPGQEIEIEFYYRSITGKAISATTPNAFAFNQLIVDRESDFMILKSPMKIIGGWRKTSIDESATCFRGLKLKFGNAYDANIESQESNGDRETIVCTRTNVPIKIRFSVSNFGDDENGEIETGEIEVVVVDEESLNE